MGSKNKKVSISRGFRRLTCLKVVAAVLFFGSTLNTASGMTTANETVQETCDYFASPLGTGNGLSFSTPFRISDFWAVAAPGITLCLLDGTYTGSDSMIMPPEYLSGSPGKLITIQAYNDGNVSIDGQGSRQPVRLARNDYLVLQGFNAYDSSGSVVEIHLSNHNVLRRIVAWDAPVDSNGKIFQISHGDFNLIEDCAGFGTARKIFEPYHSRDTTVRRVWARWEGSTRIGPKLTVTSYIEEVESGRSTLENYAESHFA